ncbi:hypothetical protein E2C01_000157 [Portunus trituberculatus]|uniref:Uncharacterized protein n=1 Tax=Portunus trituberculatus TaxID=210409 RepID=A0A5B7CIX4_PORTR|nr:hypothetical protein [Portunus trituberculatus]
MEARPGERRGSGYVPPPHHHCQKYSRETGSVAALGRPTNTKCVTQAGREQDGTCCPMRNVAVTVAFLLTRPPRSPTCHVQLCTRHPATPPPRCRRRRRHRRHS